MKLIIWLVFIGFMFWCGLYFTSKGLVFIFSFEYGMYWLLGVCCGIWVSLGVYTLIKHLGKRKNPYVFAKTLKRRR